jgi:hypothetical protein
MKNMKFSFIAVLGVASLTMAQTGTACTFNEYGVEEILEGVDMSSANALEDISRRLLSAAKEGNIFADTFLKAEFSGNKAAAIQLLQPRALKGDAQARFAIAEMSGDKTAVLELLHEFAQNGDACAMNEIALKYQSGIGVSDPWPRTLTPPRPQAS